MIAGYNHLLSIEFRFRMVPLTFSQVFGCLGFRGHGDMVVFEGSHFWLATGFLGWLLKCMKKSRSWNICASPLALTSHHSWDFPSKCLLSHLKLHTGVCSTWQLLPIFLWGWKGNFSWGYVKLLEWVPIFILYLSLDLVVETLVSLVSVGSKGRTSGGVWFTVLLGNRDPG